MQRRSVRLDVDRAEIVLRSAADEWPACDVSAEKRKVVVDQE